MGILKLVITSVVQFLRLIKGNYLHLQHDKLGELYYIDSKGIYQIFRETTCDSNPKDPLAVLIVGFRLRLIRSIPFFHWLFQRLCILTTPFWSGFSGFKVKLWLVDPKSKNYLGIYQWSGANNAQLYVNALIPVLNSVSEKGSVWFKLYPNLQIESYLRSHKKKSKTESCN